MATGRLSSSTCITAPTNSLHLTQHTRISERKLCIGDREFEMVQKFKYLGAVVDEENNITHHTRKSTIWQ
jgi:hypothetical protein